VLMGRCSMLCGRDMVLSLATASREDRPTSFADTEDVVLGNERPIPTHGVMSRDFAEGCWPSQIAASSVASRRSSGNYRIASAISLSVANFSSRATRASLMLEFARPFARVRDLFP
jgi:hypothetical protein